MKYKRKIKIRKLLKVLVVTFPNFQARYIKVSPFAFSLKKEACSLIFIGGHLITKRLKNFSTYPTLWKANWKPRNTCALDYITKLLDQREHHFSDFMVNDNTHPHCLGFDFTRVLTEESVLTNEEFGDRKNDITTTIQRNKLVKTKFVLCKIKQERETLFNAIKMGN